MKNFDKPRMSQETREKIWKMIDYFLKKTDEQMMSEMSDKKMITRVWPLIMYLFMYPREFEWYYAFKEKQQRCKDMKQVKFDDAAIEQFHIEYIDKNVPIWIIDTRVIQFWNDPSDNTLILWSLVEYEDKSGKHSKIKDGYEEVKLRGYPYTTISQNDRPKLYARVAANIMTYNIWGELTY